MESRDSFSTCHPAVNFLFFAGALIFGMFLIHPIFLVCSMVLSAAYYLTIRGRDGLKMLGGMVSLFLILSLLNPLFNAYGDTVLFTWIKGRHYTLEALLYGICLAAMVVSVLLWFACYMAVMTSDKFLYLFGKLSPGITLILTMVLRLVPEYQKKILQLKAARRCIGKGGDRGSRREIIEQNGVILSVLTSMALEGGIITADSMRSRGYGCGKRTSFSLYRWEKRDRLLLGSMLVLLALLTLCVGKGGAGAEFTPTLTIAGLSTFNRYTVLGSVVYGLFLLIPTVMNVMEELTWYILRSRI